MKAVNAVEVWAVPLALFTAFFSSLAVEFQWFSQLTIFRVLKYGGIAYSGWSFWRSLRLNKPFVMDVTAASWTRKRATPPSETQRMDMFVLIPEKVHGKGKQPNVQIVKSAYDPSFGAIDYEITKSGDVVLYHPVNSFNPLQPKEFTVKIAV